MQNHALSWYARYQRRIEGCFLAFFLALFSYAVLDALALLPGERGFQPRMMALLSGALVIQSIASLLQKRFPWVSVALMGLSVVMLVGAVTIIV